MAVKCEDVLLTAWSLPHTSPQSCSPAVPPKADRQKADGRTANPRRFIAVVVSCLHPVTAKQVPSVPWF